VYLRICPKCNKVFYLAVSMDRIVCNNCQYYMYDGQSKEGVQPNRVHLLSKGKEKRQYARRTHRTRTESNQ
jgi:C4-type Zn-finger protein